jgi:hypothetical protein
VIIIVIIILIAIKKGGGGGSEVIGGRGSASPFWWLLMGSQLEQRKRWRILVDSQEVVEVLVVAEEALADSVGAASVVVDQVEAGNSKLKAES